MSTSADENRKCLRSLLLPPKIENRMKRLADYGCVKAEVGEVAVLDVFLLTMQLIGGGEGEKG